MWRTSASPQASEGGMIRPAYGMPVFLDGAFYVLYGTPTAVGTTATETSIFTGDTSITTPLVVTAGNNPYPSNPGSTRAIPPSALNTLGTMFSFDFYGSVKTNGTPNLTFRLGLVDSAGTFNAIADTTAVAMTSEATACYLHVGGGWSIAKVGSAGSINAYIGYDYAPTGITVNSPVLATTSFDLTKAYTLDIRATWSASDASNVVTINWGKIALEG
jgi:hypothetical protein